MLFYKKNRKIFHDKNYNRKLVFLDTGIAAVRRTIAEVGTGSRVYREYDNWLHYCVYFLLAL